MLGELCCTGMGTQVCNYLDDRDIFIFLQLTRVVIILHPKDLHIFHKGLDLIVMMNCFVVLVIKIDDLTDITRKRKPDISHT